MNNAERFLSAVRCVTTIVVILVAVDIARAAPKQPDLPLTEIRVRSTLDGSLQPSLVWVPPSARKEPRPLLVYLHSWSGNYKQNNSAWLQEAARRDWIFLHPDFRGRNDHPQACGSRFARQDILDAIDYVAAHYRVDSSRIYLAGTSGGGHMAMLMAGYHPERFSAVSAWVGISDLADWHRFHTRNGKPERYARMIEQCLGGPPGSSPEIDAEYKARSPLFHLHRVGELPVELCAGVRDGKTGSVPIQHTLKAFNVIAEAGKFATISPQEMDELWTAGRLKRPQASDLADDPHWPRQILLRRFAGSARVTIFDGGHEGLPAAAVAWLEQHRRETRSASERKAASDSD